MKPQSGLLLVLQLWVELVAGTVFLISVFSAFSLMRAGGGLAMAAWLPWIIFRLRRSGWRPSRLDLTAHWPFLILSAVCLLSLVAGPHDFLDSFSYRIPQMLLWFQEGHPWSVPHVDMRINQMPHVWSFISTPFFLLFKTWGLAIPNFISYLILYGILHAFAQSVKLSTEKKKWVLCIFMASPVMVMQAASNDNVLTCVTLIMISACFALLQKPSTSSVAYSALAFALACGIKPQYVTLAPLWLIWFFAGSRAPWKSFQWRILWWLIPLVVLCSPLPTFAVNHFLYGGITHPHVPESVKTAEREDHNEPPLHAEEAFSLQKFNNSITSLAGQMLALPVNPLAGQITSSVQSKAEEHEILKKLALHRFRVWPLVIPENASFGFFATIPFLIGIFLGLKHRCKHRFLLLGSAAAMFLAILLTTPGTLGRSFVGFFVLMLPFAFCGLQAMRLSRLRVWSLLCLMAGIGVVILNPACPLWPARAFAESINNARLKKELIRYSKYSERSRSGRELVASVPASEDRVGAIIRDVYPATELWRPFSLRREVIFYPPDVDAARLRKDGVSYLVIQEPRLVSEGALREDFLIRTDSIVVKEKKYTSYMQRGPEAWFLVKLQ